MTGPCPKCDGAGELPPRRCIAPNCRCVSPCEGPPCRDCGGTGTVDDDSDDSDDDT